MCPDCENWKRRIKAAEEAGDDGLVKTLKSLYLSHLIDAHPQPQPVVLWKDKNVWILPHL